MCTHMFSRLLVGDAWYVKTPGTHQPVQPSAKACSTRCSTVPYVSQAVLLRLPQGNIRNARPKTPHAGRHNVCG